MGSCAAPSAKRDDKFITTDYLQQCHKIVIVPSFDALNNLVSKDSTLNVFYSKNSLNDGDTLSVELVNRDQWNAKAGKHTMTLNVGTYSI